MSSVTAVPLQPVKRSYKLWLWLGILVAVVAAAALAWAGTSTEAVATNMPNDAFLAWNERQPGVQTTASGLQYKVLEPGDGGKHPTANDVALIGYVGKLRNGKQFDASQRPVPMPLGPGQVIPGFSEAVQLMPRKAKYRFWIPPELGYKDQAKSDPTGKEVIPANAILVFDVTLEEFIPASEYQQMMMSQMGGQGRGGPDIRPAE